MVDTPKIAADLAPQFQDGTVPEHGPEAVPARAIRIEIDGEGFGRFWVGGEQVGALINEVTITARVGKKTTVVWGDARTDLQIEIGSPLLAEIADGYRHLRLNDAHRSALISLGWTPPAEEMP
jgi:hypothetical protein